MLDPKTPWEVAKWNIIAYWGLQVFVWMLLFFAILYQHDALLIIFWINVCIPIISYWTTARQCRTAYLNKEPDDVWDFAIPFFIVTAIGVACYHATKGLLR